MSIYPSFINIDSHNAQWLSCWTFVQKVKLFQKYEWLRMANKNKIRCSNKVYN